MIEMKINYLEPIPPGEVIAEAYVLRSSRRSAYAEVDIWSQGKLAAARSLRRAPVRLTLVDRRNHHLFQPLLYQWRPPASRRRTSRIRSAPS